MIKQTKKPKELGRVEIQTRKGNCRNREIRKKWTRQKCIKIRSKDGLRQIKQKLSRYCVGNNKQQRTSEPEDVIACV